MLGPSPLPALADYPLDALARRATGQRGRAARPRSSSRSRAAATARRIVNITSDAAVEAVRGLGRLRRRPRRRSSSSRASSPPSTRTCASTPSTPATCARRCTRTRSRARTSPTGRRPRTACPALLALLDERPAQRPLPRGATSPACDRVSALAFDARRRALEAHEPPEARGLAPRRRAPAGRRRAAPGARRTRASRDLPALLEPGDLLVVNTSATLPAALAARRADGRPAARRTSRPPVPGEDDRWVVELRARRAGAAARRPRRRARSRSPAAPRLELARALRRRHAAVARARSTLGAPLLAATCDRHGTPIRYGYVRGDWPLDGLPDRVRAPSPAAPRCRAPGGRSRAELVTRLVAARRRASRRSSLHTGVSSLEARRAALPRALRGAARHRAARQRDARAAAGASSPSAPRSCARSRPSADADGTVRAGRRLDRPRHHAGARRARRRRPAHRLARAARRRTC